MLTPIMRQLIFNIRASATSGPADWDPLWSWESTSGTTLETGVKYWADSTAGARFEQLTLANQPPISAADANFGGVDVIRFADSADSLILNTTDVPLADQKFASDGTGDYYAAIVCSFASSGNSIVIDSSNNGAGTGVQLVARGTSTSYLRVYNGASIAGTVHAVAYTANAPQLYEFYYKQSSNTFALAMNGGAFATTVPGALSAGNAATSLDLRASSVLKKFGTVFFSRVIPDATRRSNIISYVNTKYSTAF